jgi:hypothetical protein
MTGLLCKVKSYCLVHFMTDYTPSPNTNYPNPLAHGAFVGLTDDTMI